MEREGEAEMQSLEGFQMDNLPLNDRFEFTIAIKVYICM
jgi:hypothetical protein